MPGGFRSHVGRAFVSFVARSCREPFQRWKVDRKGTLSRGIPSSTNELRFHRGPIMSSARRLPEPCRQGCLRRQRAFVSIVAQSCQEPFQPLCRRRSTGRAPCREVLSNWMKSDFSTRFSKCFSSFITSTTQFSSSAHIFHVCRARIIKIQFSYVSKCCVFDISTHTFSGRYKLMETTLLCFRCLLLPGLLSF